ncbi:DNA-binding transcriptional regulator, MarR family [Octadecabacter temperatus]|uniref:HTH-type transcriptional repressor NicR n=1 Tax=Octadecabacter temperatus TaxID=1458307 RepID=A0A0K0Y2I7_9RHOB|nr:MarR family transcriptional regulator [Octadecabacter temperatus]AKS45149.1 HTH-type transcriptional repressor NicR [Octadecabacter temperatus]SIN87156.1 DNA-binding transcriptional regulator, MarR family [Octadecabacter temperatus]
MTTDQEDEIYQLDEQVGFLLRLASQRHAVIFQNHIKENLTGTQFSTLMRLAEHGRVTQNHLGRLASMDIATTKGVVDRLRVKGLVKSEPDKTDKRRSVISLTDKGSALSTKLKHHGKDITAETLSPISAREQDILIGMLKKIS